ncbi:MAG: bifunctional hydroxymethylpyrimidine kinase/phosphomethylpyrimidine kinase [Gemmatimonadota bacterium]|nr:bifunctional hydroxymethylpyrimidine kinase/phosphomethylpyrimidine kinase [Gemmatimonadota bacterium]MDE2873063.1 bifunctional hydroxymethylpyrimidine kinase/phosphomethylpyrimidine kinase [Gemmatimonadota bacterium]
MTIRKPPPVALTIAGSDSGGGAGIQADLKTFHQWGVFGTSAVTAVTAQNTLGVQEIHPVPAATITAQIRSVATDLPPRAVKSGMLATAGIVVAVAKSIRRHRLCDYVLDPVMVATSGDALLAPGAVAAVRHELLPLATIVTPNWPEAALLTQVTEPDPPGMARAARALVDAGAGAALVKGGHLGGDEVVDLFWDGDTEVLFRGPRIETRHTHGTGCSLSAAITAGLARGTGLEAAVDGAVRWVREAIAGAPGLGGGAGPLNHFVEADPM